MCVTAQSAFILHENKINGTVNVDNKQYANGHGGGLNDQKTDQSHHTKHALNHDSDYTRSVCVCFWLLDGACWLLAVAGVLLPAGC